MLVCDFLVFPAPGSYFHFIKKAKHVHFSGSSVGTVDREVLGLNPSTDASFHGYTVKEFHKIRCPAIAQHSQEITPSKGRYSYGIKLCSVPPPFRASHFLWACHSTVWHSPKRVRMLSRVSSGLSAFSFILKLPLRNCHSYLKNKTEQNKGKTHNKNKTIKQKLFLTLNYFPPFHAHPIP